MYAEAKLALIYMSLATVSTITGDQSLLTWSLIGAIGGGLCGAAMMPDSTTVTKRGIRWIVSSFLGFALTSPVMHYWKIAFEPDKAFPIAVCISLLIWKLVVELQKKDLEYFFSIFRKNP